MRKIHEIIIHCSASGWGNADVIRKWHVDGNGWDDIGYHYVINSGRPERSADFDPDWDGFLETGRPLDIAGAHCKGHNAHSVGICLIGEGTGLFTPRQIKVLRGLIDTLRASYNLGPESVFGHRAFTDKACPGFDVQAWL